MKKIFLVLGVTFFSVTSFASISQDNSRIVEQPPSCFQTCNAVGQIFKDMYGWTAIEFGTWVVGCTNSCEAQNQ